LRSYYRYRLGAWETVVSHYRRHPTASTAGIRTLAPLAGSPGHPYREPIHLGSLFSNPRPETNEALSTRAIITTLDNLTDGCPSAPVFSCEESSHKL